MPSGSTDSAEASPPGVLGGELAGSRTGRWSLQYTGGCAGRESEPIDITRFDDDELHFDDFVLRHDEAGLYVGSADFIAPMPADGRDVVYTVTYSLRLEEDGKFIGTERITEDGGHSLDCPVELAPAAEG